MPAIAPLDEAVALSEAPPLIAPPFTTTVAEPVAVTPFRPDPTVCVGGVTEAPSVTISVAPSRTSTVSVTGVFSVNGLFDPSTVTACAPGAAAASAAMASAYRICGFLEPKRF
ncbi:MAG: hypothetical protein AAF763_16585 [Pseudomonadota bacterium]